MRRTTTNTMPAASSWRRSLAATGMMLLAILALAATSCNKSDPQTKAQMEVAGELIEQAKAELKSVEKAFNSNDFRKASSSMDNLFEKVTELGMVMEELSMTQFAKGESNR